MPFRRGYGIFSSGRARNTARWSKRRNFSVTAPKVNATRGCAGRPGLSGNRRPGRACWQSSQACAPARPVSRRLLPAGNQHVLQAQHLVPPAVVVDEAATGHAVGAAGEQVAGKLDDHQTVMLFAHLGLQVATPARLGAVQEPAVRRPPAMPAGAFRCFPGHFQQGALDDRVQLRSVGELQGVDVYQDTVRPDSRA